ncbi:MAG: pyridoxine/pyridoxamine 5'-phosphate oxidase, partial [bacterium]
MGIEDARREYNFGRLTQESLTASPFDLFQLWLQQAIDSHLKDPTAMVVATAGEGCIPWQRMVLLKDADATGFVFFTNLGSRKAQEIAGNNQLSLLFPWNELDRQVIVGGRAEQLTRMEVVKYFLTRPKESQIAAWASRQSSRL